MFWLHLDFSFVRTRISVVTDAPCLLPRHVLSRQVLSRHVLSRFFRNSLHIVRIQFSYLDFAVAFDFFLILSASDNYYAP